MRNLNKYLGNEYISLSMFKNSLKEQVYKDEISKHTYFDILDLLESSSNFQKGNTDRNSRLKEKIKYLPTFRRVEAELNEISNNPLEIENRLIKWG